MRRILIAMMLTAAIAPRVAAAGSLAPAPPNFVFILTDDLDLQLDSLNAMPNLQALVAAQGTTFANFFVPLSLCCPSRATILRGQYPHNHQIEGNSQPLGGFAKAYGQHTEDDTLATVLQAAGYRTVLLGKYLNGYPGAAPQTYIPPGWSEWYSPAAGNPYTEYNYTLNENGRLVSYGKTPSDYLTYVIAARAVDFILRSARAGQPFFVYFATYAPHGPSTPAPRHAALFPGVQAPRTPGFNEADVSDKPAYVQGKPLLTAADIADIDAKYRLRLQSLQAVDEAIAGLVATLESVGQLANTYIVFTSDNGFHMGQHRMPNGKYTPYETDIRVPLAVRGPGVPAGVVRGDLAANVDFLQTFAEFAGATPPPFVDGRSLAPLLRAGAPAEWRRAFLLEEFNSGEWVLPSEEQAADPASPLGVLEPPNADDLAAAAAPAIPSYYGSRAPDYKYVEYATGERELYLFPDDPWELANQAGRVDPAVRARLSAHLRTLATCAAATCRASEAVAPPPLVTATMTLTPASPSSEDAITLVAAAAGTAPYLVTWDIGAVRLFGSPATVTLPPGEHGVRLTVRDAIGAGGTTTRTVTVHPSPRRHLDPTGARAPDAAACGSDRRGEP